MTKFEDQLFADLMREHGPALATLRRPAASRHGARYAARPVWLSGGVVAAAGATAAGLVMFGGGTPAFAVTQNHDGTETIALHQMSGIGGANAKLHDLGDNVVIVPVRPGCVSLSSLPKVRADTDRKVILSASGIGGSLTVNASGIPAGDIMVVAADEEGSLVRMASVITTGPAPSCVSIPIPQPGQGEVTQSAGGSGTQVTGSGGPGTVTTGG